MYFFSNKFFKDFFSMILFFCSLLSEIYSPITLGEKNGSGKLFQLCGSSVGSFVVLTKFLSLLNGHSSFIKNLLTVFVRIGTWVLYFIGLYVCFYASTTLF